MLRYGCFLSLLLLSCLSQGAFAQPAGAPVLNAQETLGQNLFYQSCGVCHTKPQITSQQFAPVLSKTTAGGNADAIRAIISEGTPHMPGFKHNFDSAQIDAIIAYLKTVAELPPQPTVNPSITR